MAIFRRIYSTYGLAVFALTFLFLMPLFFVTIKIGKNIATAINKNKVIKIIFFFIALSPQNIFIG